MTEGRPPRVVTGQEDVALGRAEFEARFRARFQDPAYSAPDAAAAVDRLAAVAWEAYDAYRKSPRTAKAGPEFADPDFDLPLEWLDARRRVTEADRRRRDPASPSRVLVVNGASRSDHTCPGEASKTWRLASRVVEVVRAQAGFEAELLDLSRLASEYGRAILPCKACVSTAMPLCHWPCSCYPNHAMGQVNDWMNDVYPMWAGAHGVCVVSPVHWYQAPSVLKLMMDRLVCADGGNPDPTTTSGKDPAKAKALELAGWPYPRHLAGRAFAVVVHGDAAGVGTLRRSLCDWLSDMGLVPAGPHAGLDRYVGYLEPYATSHDALDADRALWSEVEGVALTLVEAVRQLRSGACPPPGASLPDPRPK